MKKIGLIAGEGRFPVLFAEEARRMGVEVVALGIPGVTDPSVEGLVGRFYKFKLGEISKPIATFKAEGVSQAVMAGKVQHASLFGGVMPDMRAVKLFMGLKDKRTDTILKAVADEFAKDGIELLPSTTYLSHLLVKPGVLTRRAPRPDETSDIRLGWKAAKAVAGFDIGQTVVIRDGAVIAVEAMEGTDAAVRRAAEIARARGARPALVVVKVAKPGQDLRFDVPVVGLDSLEVFAETSVSAVALEAGSTLIFDQEPFFKQADVRKLAIVSYDSSGPKEDDR